MCGQLLGVRATPTEVDDLLKMVDRQGTGDIGYQGFTQVMTNTMNKMDGQDLEADGGASALQAAVPFEITASAYRRQVTSPVCQHSVSTLPPALLFWRKCQDLTSRACQKSFANWAP